MKNKSLLIQWYLNVIVICRIKFPSLEGLGVGFWKICTFFKSQTISIGLILLLSTLLFSSCQQENLPPNVIVVMTDDQGYGDIAAHGNPYIETPNMDKLHDKSVRLENFHVAPTCSPTRASLMTGKYNH